MAQLKYLNIENLIDTAVAERILWENVISSSFSKEKHRI